MDERTRKMKMNMQTQYIVPDVVNTLPYVYMDITYPNNVKVESGNFLLPAQVVNQPVIKWDFEKDFFYTLIMTDPDTPSREDPKTREWNHWLVGNIVACNVFSGQTISEYVGAGPRKDTGPHRYVFLAFKHDKRISFTEEKLSSKATKGRENFSTKQFAEKYGLGDPVVGNFFYAQYDESVPLLYKQFHCC